MQLISAVLFAAPAAAWLNYPFLKSGDSSSWTPPQETKAAAKDAPNIVEGWSPRPTTGPKPLFGRMNIEPRLDGYTLGPATCGFIRSNDHVIACSSAGMTCAFEDGYAGCCVPNESCSAVKRKCLNYSQSKAGMCASSLLTDYHTVCCNLPSQGECYTWSIDLEGGNGRPSGGYTVYDCSSTAGKGTLLNYDPVWAATHVASSTEDSSTTSTTTESTTSTSAEATNTSGSSGNDNSDNNGDNNGSGGKKKKSNVGAIAGGAVGGVAALGLIGAAIFLLMRRNKKKDGNATAGSSPAAPMSQQTYSPPPQKQSPAASYPSGVPSQHGYPPQPYSPEMNAYNQQQQYPPPGVQQPYQQQPQYPPQQQWGAYGHPTSPTGVSPGTHTTPSPGFNTSPGPMGAAAHSPPPQNVSELGAVNPIGAESNRAELH